ncbi:MAG TPA: cellulase family glycosylhydrolase [Oceanobacillus sp.]|nr:cellulase family glycosylhydrolase [Oceanobacillus sp.]
MKHWFIVACLLSACATVHSQNATTPPPLATCTQAEAQAGLDALPPYQPTETEHFVQLADHRLVIGEEPFTARGVNYYPMRYPWRRFLTTADTNEIQRELNLLRMVGFNTLRLFLWNEALFTCPARGAVPNAENFRRLDKIIHTAAARDFRLIVTLNDLPDLEHYPLYHNPAHIQAQTAFIVERYRNEPTILAWDLRNEGDIDYGSINLLNMRFPRDVVLNWLEQTSQQVRDLDPNHLITAGWLFDAEATAPYVDFVSFHHWQDATELARRIQAIQEVTDKPILLEEFGFSTFRVDEDEQAQLIRDNIRMATEYDLLGWLVWTAFDFPLDATCIPPACPSQDNAEHHFGLWRTDYTAKPAVEIVEQYQGSNE